MEKEQQIYVRYGDFVIFHLENLQGNVICQSFTNRSVYLQMNPNKMCEVLMRNSRDMIWQVCPRMAFDARKDFDNALELFEKTFGSQSEDISENEKNTENNATDLNQSRASQTSFFGNHNQNKKKLKPGRKKDRDSFKSKLQQLYRKLCEEEIQNQRTFESKAGEIVEYGHEIQLMHQNSQRYLQATKSCADEDNSCNKVELAIQGSQQCYFKVVGGFRYKQEGDFVHYNDQIVLLNTKNSMFLHVTEKFLKVEGLEGWINDGLKAGIADITPNSMDRREPPQSFMPVCEVNASTMKTKFSIQIYRYFNEDLDDKFIKGGSIVRLHHSEKSGYLHSDDKDFTNDGIAEVYLWNAKGKASDVEATSSFSLFQIEIAQPLKKAYGGQKKSSKFQEDAIESSRIDPNDRIGQVYNYSKMGGLAANDEVPFDEEVHYRFRHLNTGRLLIDQTSETHQGSMKTLGLSPHLVFNDLEALSDKVCEQVTQYISMLQTSTSYQLDRGHSSPYAPKNYKEIDMRSRFRIISTSPSLDPRITSNSCVQIQHVNSEMYLSYASKGTLGFYNQDDVTSKNKADAANQYDKLFVPVNDDDITSGTREAVELKPIRSNEDAFFIEPESDVVLSNIFFIQTAVDLLMRYLPTITSNNLVTSREKANKIFGLLQAIYEFLIDYDPNSVIEEENLNMQAGFSKETNDILVRQQYNYKLRQKLMRELFVVESFVHILYLPFREGDYNLEEVKKGDPIVTVCQKAYNLIKMISQNYYQNELYVSQWINLYFHHAMSTGKVNAIGAEETIISLVDNNQKLLEIQIDESIIQKFIDLCMAQLREKRLIQLLRAVCSCHGQPIRKNQDDVVLKLLKDDEARNFLMMPVRMTSDNSVDVLIDSETATSWKSLTKYKEFGRSLYGYFLSIIDLSAELCLGRNKGALDSLQEMYSFDVVKQIVKDRALPFEIRALFIRVLEHMHMDRDSLNPIQIPALTGVWDEVPHFIKEHYIDPANMIYPITQSKIPVPSSLKEIKKFVEIYLEETQGIQNITEVGKNQMTFQILKIIQFMLNHGFYQNLRELREVAKPMINMLNGANDVYFTEEERKQAGNFEEFVSCKRYFTQGNNDIIVNSKAIICDNLLTISQLEFDGKVQIFLSKFKADIEVFLLSKQLAKGAGMQGINEEEEEKEEEQAAQDEQKKEEAGKKGDFWDKFNSIGVANEEKKPGNSLKEILATSVDFLEEIAKSFNFEAENQDSYICVLFDLLLYRYPKLAKGVFELMVRLFARKRTLLENITRMQMLENPKSIKILNKVKKMHTDLKKYIEDADQWLNKANSASIKVKYNVTKIFLFFSQICKQELKTRNDDEESQAPDKGMDKKKEMEMQEEETLLTPEEFLWQKLGKPSAFAKKKSSSAAVNHSDKVNIKDFILFNKSNQPQNKENQRLLANFGIEKLAMFFIKYRVERTSVADPFYQQLIHHCYNFLVAYVKDNLQNQIKVHDHLEIFLRDIDKNPLISLLIFEMFKDNKKFLTLNVSKILRQIILSAEEASLQSSKKALYLKLLEVFCKFEDKIVRPNQQEIVINFTRDVSKNNLIYLFSNEGLERMFLIVQKCLPKQMQLEGVEEEENQANEAQIQESNEPEKQVKMSIEVFNVIVCMQLMSICCEGKSDLAELKCQREIMGLAVAVKLYKKIGRFWPFKAALLDYITHVFLDSGNPKLFSDIGPNRNKEHLTELIIEVQKDMVLITDEWLSVMNGISLVYPDGTENTFGDESKKFVFNFATKFIKQALKNKRIEFGHEIFPTLAMITEHMCKNYYATDDDEYRSNSMDTLTFINYSEKWARLLDNLTHPANQNIYAESAKIAKEGQMSAYMKPGDAQRQRSGQLTQKLGMLVTNQDLIEKKEREFELLVLWVSNIDNRIACIMKHDSLQKGPQSKSLVAKSFANVNYDAIVSSFMSLLDSNCLSKEMHLTGLTLLRKLVEVENHELTTPAADWESEEWDYYQDVIAAKQTSLVDIGCIEFLCKHMQEHDEIEILEETFLVSITLLLGGNIKSQNAFFYYFQNQDKENDILKKLKHQLMERFDLARKFIGEKNAKLAMIYKINQRQEQRELEEKKEVEEEGNGKKKVQKQESDSENLLSMENQEDDKDAGASIKRENQLQKCMRLLRFLQLLTEGHHSDLQNYLREQTYPNGQVNQKTIDFISFMAQMLAIYEKQFINCFSCELGMQLFDTLIEVVQGPCKENQKRLVEAKIIDCCRDLISQGMQTDTELRMRGFTEENQQFHDKLKMQSVKLLLSIIEGSIELPVYRQIAESLDDFQILTKRLEQIYKTFVQMDLQFDPDESVENITALLTKESFQGPIREGFDIFCLVNQLAAALEDVKGKIQVFEKSNTFQFFKFHTGNVEVVKNGDLIEIFFPIQPVCRKMRDKTKENFKAEVKIESNQHKLMGLVGKVYQFNDEMEHLEACSHDFIEISPERLDFLRDFSTGIAVAISFLVIGFYRYDRQETADGSSDYVATIDDFPDMIMNYLGIIQLTSSILLLVGFAYNNSSIIVKQGWRQKIEENKKILVDDVVHLLQKYQPKYGQIQANNLPLDAMRVLLLTEGPYHQAWGKEGERNYQYFAVYIEYIWISLSFLMNNNSFLFQMLYMAISMQGSFQSPVFYSLHLLDIINRSPDLGNVVQSVTKNYGMLVMTALLGFIFIYIYSLFAFVFVSDTYYDDMVHAGLLNRKGDSVCQSMLHCFLSTVNYGVRGGGGIGEFLPTQTAVPENAEGFYFRAVFDLSFFLLVITILLNIIFGIIIDTFGQLREENNNRTWDAKNICFVCDLERQVFDRELEGGFETHQEVDHNIWMYLFFIIHLREIESADLNGNESHVLKMFETGDIGWFPMAKSLRLQRIEEKKQAGNAEQETVDEIMAKMNNNLDTIEDKVREIAKKF